LALYSIASMISGIMGRTTEPIPNPKKPTPITEKKVLTRPVAASIPIIETPITYYKNPR